MAWRGITCAQVKCSSSILKVRSLREKQGHLTKGAKQLASSLNFKLENIHPESRIKYISLVIAKLYFSLCSTDAGHLVGALAETSAHPHTKLHSRVIQGAVPPTRQVGSARDVRVYIVALRKCDFVLKQSPHSGRTALDGEGVAEVGTSTYSSADLHFGVKACVHGGW